MAGTSVVPAPAAARTAALQAALRAGDPVMVFQPIIDLATGNLTSYEALARFPRLPGLTPDQVFGRATADGGGADLEALAVLKALDAPGRPLDVLLSVNLSPSALQSQAVADVLPQRLTGLQLEITEHEHVADIPALLNSLDLLRDRGARIAVDDVGEGYSGLQRVMALEPDVLKLDRSLVTGVRHRTAKAALVESIVRYAGRTGALVCAEGIETASELAVLADLDVAQGQGWFIGRPEPSYPEPSEPSRAVCRAAMHDAVTVSHSSERGDEMVPLLTRLAAAVDLPQLARTLQQLAPVIGATSVELSYLSADATYVAPVRHVQHGDSGPRFYLSELPLTQQVLDTDVAAQVVLGLPDADPGESAWMQEDGVGSLLMVPVPSARGVVGLLECHRVERAPWRRKQIRDARTMAAVVGPALATLLP